MKPPRCTPPPPSDSLRAPLAKPSSSITCSIESHVLKRVPLALSSTACSVPSITCPMYRSSHDLSYRASHVVSSTAARAPLAISSTTCPTENSNPYHAPLALFSIACPREKPHARPIEQYSATASCGNTPQKSPHSPLCARQGSQRFTAWPMPYIEQLHPRSVHHPSP